MKTLDKSRSFNKSINIDGPPQYFQDGIEFDADGNEVIKETKAVVNIGEPEQPEILPTGDKPRRGRTPKNANQ